MRKRVFALVVVSVVYSLSAGAQWQPNDPAQTGDIYYNGGKVGIGTATPAAQLHVISATDASVILDGATASTAQILMRKGGADSVQLRREASSNDFTILTGGSERLRVAGTGRVGIGTNAPAAHLHVVTSSTLSQLTLSKSTSVGVISAYIGGADSMSLAFDASYSGSWYAQHTTAGWISKVGGKLKVQGSSGNTAGSVTQGIVELMTIDLATGKVGIGVSFPSYRLDVAAANDLTMYPRTPVTMAVVDTNASTTPNTGSGLGFMARYNAAGAQTVIAAVSGIKELPDEGSYAGALTFGTRNQGNNGSATMERMRITSAGRVGIGTTTPETKLHVVGDVRIDGTLTGITVIGAVYQDVAEWVPAAEDMLPGTVVVLDPSVSNQVMPSHRAYDLTVAGVVSAQPGVILGVGSPTKEQIATTGRVRVNVDATRGAIAIGDILVTSDKSGMAMKSHPLDLGGIAIHRPGTVVGKALEPLAGGEGQILVLLSLQ